MGFFTKYAIYFVCLSCATTALSKDIVDKSNIDFVHYQAEITPNFINKSIDGVVEITFTPQVQNVNYLSFSSEFKRIKSVYFDGKKLSFSVENDLLRVKLPASLKTIKTHSVKMDYSASPTQGMKFYDDHLFTVFHTNKWLISHNDLSDKATFDLSIKHDVTTSAVGNGTLVSRKKVGNTLLVSRWQQNTPIPLYTFDFAVGNFEKQSIDTDSVNISMLYRQEVRSGLSAELIEKAFKDVSDMLLFFESKAGFTLKQGYTYVVVDGSMAQEASGFSLVGEMFVHALQTDKNENWFIAHELAHEWWGNSITSSNFSHFWLNEGLVVFMVDAYKQHLFGEEADKNEMKVAIERVQRAVKENRVAPVAFKMVIRESEINHTMAYSKGALVFYMLREKLGDKLFWQSLKQYSLSYQGQSATTQNLKSSFEEVSQIDLTEFFERWVYGPEIPTLDL
ncbi:M1 family aminopeptidase [Arenicella xantha]|uniref:Aminopeptidase N n=1 Tax=Arenicella xantha TaxID=644221 RepID=A0A395JFP4_9GAMM|nr:M1 family aminopeptidase [Arenicella xantha]RBP48549.1 peptidase M1-like protein [Arenicella xantha]